MKSIEAVIFELVYKNCGGCFAHKNPKSREDIEWDDSFIDLGIDDLDLIMIMDGIDENFGISVPHDDAKSWCDVGDIIEFVEKNYEG